MRHGSRLGDLLACKALAFAAIAAFAAPTLVTAARAEVVFLRGNDADPETLDSHKTSTVAESHLLRDLSDGLLIHNNKGEVVAGTAESWTISDDGLTYTFKLRDAAKWSNGEPVKASDFVYSFKRIMNPDTGAKYANILYPIKNAESVNKGKGAKLDDLGVKALGDKSLQITLERPTPYFLELLTHQTGMPVYPAGVEKFGKDFVKPENWVSNGAYTLKEYVPNSQITMVKNPNFYDAANVQIDKVVVTPNPDLAAAARRFMAGELQFTTDIPVDQIKFLREKLGSQVSVSPYLGTYFLILNSKKKPFDDVRVRQALAMSIDREFIAEEIWSGTMLPAYSFIPPGVGNYEGGGAPADFKAMSPIEREDKAKALLKDAGFGPGKPLKVELRYNTTDNNRRTVVAIADQWKQIGVETSFINTDSKTHFALLRDGGDFDAARYGWIADYSDPQNFLFLLQSDNKGFNAGGYNNPAYDALMKKAETEGDLKKRAAILKEAEATTMKDMPWIPVLFYSTKNLVSSKVEGFYPNISGSFPTRYFKIKQ